jgi:hypothetical protein
MIGENYLLVISAGYHICRLANSLFAMIHPLKYPNWGMTAPQTKGYSNITVRRVFPGFIVEGLLNS